MRKREKVNYGDLAFALVRHTSLWRLSQRVPTSSPTASMNSHTYKGKVTRSWQQLPPEIIRCARRDIPVRRRSLSSL